MRHGLDHGWRVLQLGLLLGLAALCATSPRRYPTASVGYTLGQYTTRRSGRRSTSRCPTSGHAAGARGGSPEHHPGGELDPRLPLALSRRITEVLATARRSSPSPRDGQAAGRRPRRGGRRGSGSRLRPRGVLQARRASGAGRRAGVSAQAEAPPRRAGRAGLRPESARLLQALVSHAYAVRWPRTGADPRAVLGTPIESRDGQADAQGRRIGAVRTISDLSQLADAQRPGQRFTRTSRRSCQARTRRCARSRSTSCSPCSSPTVLRPERARVEAPRASQACSRCVQLQANQLILARARR